MKYIPALFLIFCFFVSAPRVLGYVPSANSWFEIQSIDTMKYSRDKAREKLTDSSFDQVINFQVGNIAFAGATHVAIATPYDPEFLPLLTRWVAAARKFNLNVWFRGNWSGWENWFNYQSIDRQTHKQKTEQFINDNPDLFADGDIFTPCPECENGGPGDPRKTGDVSGFRQFMIDEYQMTQKAFAGIHKNVRSNFASMNGDVAGLIMNRETTARMGGVVTVDHYVKNSDQYAADIDKLVKNTGGKIMIGEFGAPIPDVTGSMTYDQQAKWLQSVLTVMSVRRGDIIGVNYWVSVGGSTQLWEDNNKAKPAVSILKSFYTPERKVRLQVKDDLKKNLANIPVSWKGRMYRTDKNGRINIPYLQFDKDTEPLTVGGINSGFSPVAVLSTPSAEIVPVTLTPAHPGIFHRIRSFFVHLFD